jgi:hypothetical protein
MIPDVFRTEKQVFRSTKLSKVLPLDTREGPLNMKPFFNFRTVEEGFVDLKTRFFDSTRLGGSVEYLFLDCRGAAFYPYTLALLLVRVSHNDFCFLKTTVFIQ